MNILNKLFKQPEQKPLPLKINDGDIVAPVNGKMFEIEKVNDPVFSKNMMGKGVAFEISHEKHQICAPVSGKITALFKTGHAFGITTNDGVEILVHCGINTVQANGDGFKILNKKQGDVVSAGEPIVEVDVAKLIKNYEVPIMLIVLKPNDSKIKFIEPKIVSCKEKINVA